MFFHPITKKNTEKATSEMIPAAQEDLVLNMEIVDMIKSKSVAPKEAMRLLKKRLIHENPNVKLLTLQLLDKCVKNGGKHFLIEFGSREFVDELIRILSSEREGKIVEEKIAELFQSWSLLLQSDPQFSYLGDNYERLKGEGVVKFPTFQRNSTDYLDPSSIFNTCAPPEWTDSPNCLRCRDSFTFTNRKHHCRRCGGTFCTLCSSKQMPLIDMGLIEPVRVCDSCYQIESSTRNIRKSSTTSEEAPKLQEANEDEDLKRAIQLSLKEDTQNARKIDEKEEEEEKMIKKAIEASIRDFQPQSYTQVEVLTDIESENIQLFSQLINRIVAQFNSIPSADAHELKSLTEEMRALRKRLEKTKNRDSKVETAIQTLSNSLETFGNLTKNSNMYGLTQNEWHNMSNSTFQYDKSSNFVPMPPYQINESSPQVLTDQFKSLGISVEGRIPPVNTEFLNEKSTLPSLRLDHSNYSPSKGEIRFSHQPLTTQTPCVIGSQVETSNISMRPVPENFAKSASVNSCQPNFLQFSQSSKESPSDQIYSQPQPKQEFASSLNQSTASDQSISRLAGAQADNTMSGLLEQQTLYKPMVFQPVILPVQLCSMNGCCHPEAFCQARNNPKAKDIKPDENDSKTKDIKPDTNNNQPVVKLPLEVKKKKKKRIPKKIGLYEKKRSRSEICLIDL